MVSGLHSSHMLSLCYFITSSEASGLSHSPNLTTFHETYSKFSFPGTFHMITRVYAEFFLFLLSTGLEV